MPRSRLLRAVGSLLKGEPAPVAPAPAPLASDLPPSPRPAPAPSPVADARGGARAPAGRATGWEELEKWLGDSGEMATPAQLRALQVDPAATTERATAEFRAPGPAGDPWAAALRAWVAADCLTGTEPVTAQFRAPGPAGDPWAAAMAAWVAPVPAPSGKEAPAPKAADEAVVEAGVEAEAAPAVEAPDEAPLPAEPRTAGKPSPWEALEKWVAEDRPPGTGGLPQASPAGEQERATGEWWRAHAEAGRIAAEETRREAEQGRAEAEEERQRAETLRGAREAQRLEEDQARRDAEALRAQDHRDAIAGIEGACARAEEARRDAQEAADRELALLAEVREGARAAVESLTSLGEERLESLEEDIRRQAQESRTELAELGRRVALERERAAAVAGRVQGRLEQALEDAAATRARLEETLADSARIHEGLEDAKRAAEAAAAEQRRSLEAAEAQLRQTITEHDKARQQAEAARVLTDSLAGRLTALDEALLAAAGMRADAEGWREERDGLRRKAQQLLVACEEGLASIQEGSSAARSLLAQIEPLAHQAQVRAEEGARLAASLAGHHDEVLAMAARAEQGASSVARLAAKAEADADEAAGLASRARGDASHAASSALAAAEARTDLERIVRAAERDLGRISAAEAARERELEARTEAEAADAAQAVRDEGDRVRGEIETAALRTTEAAGDTRALTERAEFAAARAEETAQALGAAQLESDAVRAFAERAEYAAARAEEHSEELAGRVLDHKELVVLTERAEQAAARSEDAAGQLTLHLERGLSDRDQVEARLEALEDAAGEPAMVPSASQLPGVAEALASIEQMRRELGAEQERLGEAWARLAREQAGVTTMAAQVRAQLEGARVLIGELEGRVRHPGEDAEQTSDPAALGREVVRQLRPRVDAVLARGNGADPERLGELRGRLRSLMNAQDQAEVEANAARARELLATLGA